MKEAPDIINVLEQKQKDMTEIVGRIEMLDSWQRIAQTTYLIPKPKDEDYKLYNEWTSNYYTERESLELQSTKLEEQIKVLKWILT